MDKPKFYANERVDIEDVSFLTDTVLGDFRRHVRDIFVGASAMRVIDGFTQAIQAGDTTLRITRGKALAAEGVSSVVTNGQLLSEGVAFQDLAFGALGAATYGVWIRFQYADGASANRKFYDVNGDDEKPRSVKTRAIAGWAAKISVTSPGAEWIQIFSVAWNAVGLSTSTITDTRYFLYEGKANASPAFASDWGGGNDRNNDRASFGVKTFERFAAAMLKKIEEIQSSTARWWSTPPVPLDGKVSKAGDTMTGTLTITGAHDVVVGRNIGAAGGIQAGTSFYLASTDGTLTPPTFGDTAKSAFYFDNSSTADGFNSVFFGHSDGTNRDGFWIGSNKAADNDVRLQFGHFVNSGAPSQLLEMNKFGGFYPLTDHSGSFGKAANRWASIEGDLHVAHDKIIPSNTDNIGNSKIGDRVTALHVGWFKEAAVGDLFTRGQSTTPTSQEELLIRNQQTLIVARCQFDGAGVIGSRSWNIANITKNSSGDYTIQFSQPLDIATTSVSVATEAGGVPIPGDVKCVEYLWVDATHLRIFTLRGNITNVGGTGTIYYSPNHISLTLCGTPQTLQ